jgi:hypothetical protein
MVLALYTLLVSFDDVCTNLDRAAEGVEMKLEIILIGEKLHPGIRGTGRSSQSSRGNLVLGTD